MASARAKLTFRIVLVLLLVIAVFYLFRPLYWKISSTVQDIRDNKQTFTGGLSLSLSLSLS
ncbi:hypothetical protein RHMOL_Rhmol02G0016100 [Rhododendron molle]|uniref:Uncharacterized protein n=1 Tax=Rhododendron molle TaxID=49168 RepID=A0ACC0PLW9_RHOML|nr:hypothetical protein RHMOL_Rhmol02G0016100 [Rhododendron molle]